MSFNDEWLLSLWGLIIGIPETVSYFFNWFMEPIDPTFLNVSPMMIFTGLGVGVILSLVTIHVVRLFI